MSGNRDRADAATNHATAWMLAALTAFVVYALSPGPVVWWIDHRNGGNEPAWVERVYAPLIFACDHVDAVDEFYNAYFDLFDG